MWIRIANKFTNFRAKKDLTEVKIFRNVFGDTFLKHPVICSFFWVLVYVF